jgi:hypothetical protein
MKRLLVVPVVALLAFASVPAFAYESHPRGGGDRCEEVRREVDGRIAQARWRMEERIRRGGASHQHARRERERFDEVAMHLRAVTDRAVSDGFVSPHEAREIRELEHRLDSVR